MKRFFALLVLIYVHFSLFSQSKYVAIDNDYWQNSSTWKLVSGDGNTYGYPLSQDTAVIPEGYTVTLVRTGASDPDFYVAKLNIQDGGSLDFEIRGGLTSFNLYLTDSLIVDGRLEGLDGKGVKLILSDNPVIDGDGSIIYCSLDINDDLVIAPTADIGIYGSSYTFNVASGNKVENYGSILFEVDCIAADNTTYWYQMEGSEVTIYQTFFTDGVVDAYNNGVNSVVYNSSNQDVNIKVPLDSKYQTLKISGTNTVYQTADFTILKDFYIYSGTFDAQGYDLDLKGDWYDYATYTSSSSGNVVTFSGTDDQTLVAYNLETFNDLVVNKTSGNLFINNTVQIAGTLTMTSGDIVVDDNAQLIIGTSETNLGNISYSSGKVIGTLRHWINTGTQTSYTYYVGSQNYYTPVTVTFNIADATTSKAGQLGFKFVEDYPGSNGLPKKESTNDTTVYNPFIEGYWVSDTTAGFKLGSGNTYTIDLTGKTFTSFDVTNSTRIIVRPHQDSVWRLDGAHGNNHPLNYIVERTGLDSIPWQFAFGDITDCEPPEVTSITGDFDVCKNDELDYTVNYNSTDAPTFQWWVDDGSITAGETSQTVTVHWPNDGMVTNLKVQLKNSCTYSPVYTQQINVNPVPPDDLIGMRSVPEYDTSELYKINRFDDTYTYTWSFIGDGQIETDSTEMPDTAQYVSFYSSGYDTIRIIAASSTCSGLTDTSDFQIYVYKVINSIVESGDWYEEGSWDCKCLPRSNDNVRIKKGHTITVNEESEWIPGSGTVYYNDFDINNVVVEAGGVLQKGTTQLTINGNIIDDGLIDWGTDDLTFAGNDITISGEGEIDAANLILGGKQTFDNSADLTIDAVINIGSNTITNNGSVLAKQDIVADAGGVWSNQGTLEIQGALFPNQNGVLQAYYTDNTVAYTAAADQTIYPPDANTDYKYYTLKLGGSGTKSPSYNQIYVLGDLYIEDQAVLDLANDIYLEGDWVNTSTAADPFIEGTKTVYFVGSGEQYIYTPVEETFYNLKIGTNSTTILRPRTFINVSNDFILDGTLKFLTTALHDTMPSFIYQNEIINSNSTGQMAASLFFNAKQFHYVAPVFTGQKSSAFTRATSVFNPNFYWYNENVDLDGDETSAPLPYDSTYLQKGWAYAYNSDKSDWTLSVIKGFAYYYDADVSVDLSGLPSTLNTQFDTTLSYNPNDPYNDTDHPNDDYPDYYDGWNLLSNPFPAYLSFDDVYNSTSTSGIDEAVYIWDGDQYAGYADGVAVMTGNFKGNIPPFQAFMVRANTTGATLHIDASMRVHDNSQMYLKKTYDFPLVRFGVRANGYNDYMAVKFDESKKTLQLGSSDVIRLFSPKPAVPHIYTQTADNAPVALYSLPLESKNLIILPVFVKVGQPGNYNIVTTDITQLDGYNVFLYDKAAQKYYDLKSQREIEFSYTPTDTAVFDLIIDRNDRPFAKYSQTAAFAYEDNAFNLALDQWFKDPDWYQPLQYVVVENDAGWLAFDGKTFSGTPTQDDIGSYTVKICATDGSLTSDTVTVSLMVLNTNDKPVCTQEIPQIVVSAGQNVQLGFDVFSDPDPQDVLTYKFDGLPSWLHADLNSLQLIGTPEPGDVGVYDITVTAQDQAKATATANARIIVLPSWDQDRPAVFPNPAQDVLYVYTPGFSGMLTIYSIDGKAVQTVQVTSDVTKIDVSGLMPNVYTISFNQTQIKFIKK